MKPIEFKEQNKIYRICHYLFTRTASRVAEYSIVGNCLSSRDLKYCSRENFG